MFLSRHSKQPQIAPVFLGIPRNEAVLCDECNSITKAVNARCGICKSDAIAWISAFVPGRPEPPDPSAAQVLPIPVHDAQKNENSVFSNFLKLAFRTILPVSRPNRKPAYDWSSWTERQHAIEELLSIPTIIRERASLSNHPAA